MNIGGGEAADQMVRMLLSGTEVVIRLSGSALKNLLALCAGYRGAAPCWGQGARPIGGLRAASPIGSRVKRLAQGELMPCVNLYWVLPDADFRRICGFAAFPRPRNIFAGRRKIV